jgi:hypothetical protein
MGILADIGSFNLQRDIGAIQRGEAEVAAKSEEAAGTQREADRKAQLSEALASQNAAAGTAGIAAFEGSPLSVMQEDVRRESVATERDVFQTKLSALTLRSRGKIAERTAKAGATLGLITDLEARAAQAAGGGGGGKRSSPAPVTDLSR